MGKQIGAAMKIQFLAAVMALLTLGISPGTAQDHSSAEALYKKVCRNCHGPQAKGMASFPRLVGLSAEHIVSRLQAYRAGEKVGANSALMFPVAAELTDEEIAGLAAYITQELD